MIFEIRKVRNGYAIYEGSQYGEMRATRQDPWVFESLVAALNFLQDKFKKETYPENGKQGDDNG